MNQIVVATKNPGKVEEFKTMLSRHGYAVKSLLDFDEPIDDIVENGQTFEENAAIKAETISQQFGVAVLADDSGLEVDALEGRPGIYSARYAGEHKSDHDNLQKVLNELQDMPDNERAARFVCSIALATVNEETLFVRGTCEGSIAREPRGHNGFGYDPIFIPNGANRTLAEHSAEEKNAISHRAEAIRQIDQWLTH
ncbi:XTP/dITP diphosphatase [Thalassobacillus sp. CUG 92003]|uniref:XTP/dITP diphosphatase n=1 Tax=Thalassobacillus sp. CUG 92003 TaxID=2736641 RepID=UPI0015E6E415|nr:XTP/dITP diphosphatase [Thalassobacillus sp. CUG 92003]